MARAQGRVLLRSVSITIAIATVGFACHHESPQPRLEPGETLPLPPSSGTPIAYLVDAASDLKLTDDQLAKLRELDGTLATRLESIDA